MKTWFAIAAALAAVVRAQEPTEVLLSTYNDDSMGLHDAAKASGKYMGTATDAIHVPEMNADVNYMKELQNPKDWGMLTSANLMKPLFLQPTRGNFTYEEADKFVAYAKSRGYKVRCHTLVWYHQTPTWLTDGNWTKDTLLDALTDHITHVMTHFGDDCYAWDVVNEAAGDAGGYRDSFWYKITGPDYIAHAFNVANQVKQKLGLKVKLYYNDYFIEYAGTTKANFALQMIKDLLTQGVKIDGVGMQTHFIVGQAPSQTMLETAMKSYTDLGLDVAATELDLQIKMPPSLDAQKQQVKDYAAIIGACKSVEKCVGVTLWDFDDTYSWVPGVYTGMGWATPWYQHNNTGALIRKACYDGMIGAWGLLPTPAPTAALPTAAPTAELPTPAPTAELPTAAPTAAATKAAA